MTVRISTRFILAGVALLAATGCQTAGHGLVTQDSTPGEATVKLGSDDDVVVGSRVKFVNENCDNDAATNDTRCEPVTITHGTVTQVLEAHKSIVRVDDGEKMDPGTTVQLDTAH